MDAFQALSCDRKSLAWAAFVVSVLVHSLVLSCLRRCSLCITCKTVCAAGWLREELRYQSSRYHAEQRGAQQWLLNDLLRLACAFMCAHVVACIVREHMCAAIDETCQPNWAIKELLPKLTLRKRLEALLLQCYFRCTTFGISLRTFLFFPHHLHADFIDLI